MELFKSLVRHRILQRNKNIESCNKKGLKLPRFITRTFKETQRSMCVYDLKRDVITREPDALIETKFTCEVHLVQGLIDNVIIDSNLTDEHVVEAYSWEYLGPLEAPQLNNKFLYVGYGGSYWKAHPLVS